MAPYLENLFGLKGRVAVVTGAAGQLGGEYTKALLEAGAAVAALDIRLDNPSSILGKLPAERLLVERADITRRLDLERAAERIQEKLGPPSILVNNAAIDAPPGSGDEATGPFETTPESAWDQMMEVNLKGMFLCCQVFGGRMARAQGGSIINISSIYGILSPDQRIYSYHDRPFFKPAAYSASKGGVLALTRYLATYWAKQGVRVNALVLGGVLRGQDPRFLAGYTQKVPLGRMADPGDYCGALVFLASEASRYMTGSQVVIDGGFSSW